MATLDQPYANVYMQPNTQSGPWWNPQDATTYGTPASGSFLNMGMSQGQPNQLDPDLTAAMGYLRSIMEGQNVPFTDAVKRQMLGQQSGMNAAAEATQANALCTGAAVGGASARDPSLQGALRQQMAARQGANTTAAGNIATQATLSNASARQGAGQQLAGWGNAREARLKNQDTLSLAQAFSGNANHNQPGNSYSSFLQMPNADNSFGSAAGYSLGL